MQSQPSNCSIEVFAASVAPIVDFEGKWGYHANENDIILLKLILCSL